MHGDGPSSSAKFANDVPVAGAVEEQVAQNVPSPGPLWPLRAGQDFLVPSKLDSPFTAGPRE
eukprot:7238580-Pyramimonas_sp.AAC.1